MSQVQCDVKMVVILAKYSVMLNVCVCNKR